MRKIAHNRQNFTVKKRNFFVFDRIWLKFKLDLNIVESKFPIDFQGRSTKKIKSYVFLRDFSIFVTLCTTVFDSRKIE